MKAVKFKESNIEFAKNQNDYITLHAHMLQDDTNGVVTSCWSMSLVERIKVLFTGKVWLQSLTFKSALQPVKMEVNKPVMDEGKLAPMTEDYPRVS